MNICHSRDKEENNLLEEKAWFEFWQNQKSLTLSPPLRFTFHFRHWDSSQQMEGKHTVQQNTGTPIPPLSAYERAWVLSHQHVHCMGNSRTQKAFTSKMRHKV